MDERHQLRLERINAKGWDIAQRLSELKAGQDVRLSDMKGLDPEKVGMTPEEKLRAWLDAINRARQRLDSDEFGRCTLCDVELHPVALDEVPWMECCSSCAR